MDKQLKIKFYRNKLVYYFKSKSKVFIVFIFGILIGFAISGCLFHKTGTMKWIFNSGSAVQWVSAIGTLIAVGTTIVLYIKDQQKKIIILFQIENSIDPQWKVSALNTSKVTIWLYLIGFKITNEEGKSLSFPPISPKFAELQRLEVGKETQPYYLTMEYVINSIESSGNYGSEFSINSATDKISITATYMEASGKTYYQTILASKKNLKDSIKFAKGEQLTDI